MGWVLTILTPLLLYILSNGGLSDHIHQLERRGADIQRKVKELEQLNQTMRNRDKMKDDAIAHLSDQLVAITARLQELERRQITV